MPIFVEVEGRDAEVEFPDGTHPSIIKRVLAENFPPTGAEIYAKAMFDPQWAADKMSRKEHKRMRAWQGEQDPERLKNFAEGFTHMLGEVASGTWETGKNIIPHPLDTISSVVAGAVVGTADLGMIVDKMFTLNAYDTYQKYLSGKGVSDTESARKDWEATMLDDYRDYRKQMDYMARRGGMVKSTPNPKIVQAASYVLDPTLFIPAVGVGSKVATGLAGGAAKYAGEGLIEVAKGSGKGAAYGAGVGGVVGGVTGLATTGTLGGALTGAAAFGVPGGLIGKYGVSNIGTIPERVVGRYSEEAGKAVQEATEGVTGGALFLGGGAAIPVVGPVVGTLIGGTSAVKGLGATMRGAGEILQATGQSIKEGGRLGPLGGAARILDEGSNQQKIAQQLSRFDPMLGLAGAAGRGAAVGTGIGTGLGALAEGWDTPAMWQASGGGLGLGGFAGVLGTGISKATGAAYKVKLMQDLERFAGGRADGEQIMRFAETLSVKELPLMIDALGTLNHTSIHFVDNEGSKKVLSDLAALEGRVLTEAENQPFNGMVLSEPDANGVVQAFINVDSANATTVPHELLHSLVLEEKKGDFIAEVKTNLVGYRDRDGSMLQEGLLRPEELQAYAEAYAKNLLPELRAEFLAKVDEGLKGNRELLDQVVEEFAADYFVEFLKGKPREYLLRKGKPTVMQTIFNRASQLFTSRLRDDLNDMGVKYDFEKGTLQEGFYDDKGKRIRLKVLDDMLDTLVKAEKSVDADKSGGGTKDKVNIKNMTPEQQKKLLEAQGAGHFMTVDKDGDPVMRTEGEISSLEAKNAEAIVSALKEDAAETGAIFKDVEEGGKSTTEITLTDAAVRKLLENQMLDEGLKQNLALIHDLIKHPEKGNIIQMGYFSATKPRAKNPAKRVYASLGLSVRDVLPYQVTFNKEGGLYFKGVDWSIVRKRANAVWKKPKVRELFGDNKQLFWEELRAYLENLTNVNERGKPVSESAELFGVGKRDVFRETMGPRGDDPLNRPLDEYQIIPENQKEALHPYKSFRVDRISKMNRTAEPATPLTERDTYHGMQMNLQPASFQPASFKPEKLPGGEAWMHESGYSILKKGRGKFRVYKPDHELLGIRDTMKSAASLAGRSSRKEVAKFQPSPEIDPLGMFSKAESAALELKQAKGSGQQMLAMLKKAGVKPEEMQYLGLDEFLKDKKSVTKDEIHDHIVENQITVEETMLGAAPEPLIPPIEVGMVGDIYMLTDTRTGQTVGNPTGYSSMDAAQRGMMEQAGKSPPLPTKHPTQVEPGAVEGSYRELLLRLPEKLSSAHQSFRDFRSAMQKKYSIDDRYLGDLEDHPGSPLSPSERATYNKLQADMLSGPDRVEPYTGGHYGEYPNTLAHIRFNERTGPKGEKVLFVEEIQSDWHQAGRKKGYSDPQKLASLKKRYDEVVAGRAATMKEGETVGQYREKYKALHDEEMRLIDEMNALHDGVPDAPFKTSWHELAMKRMIKYAVDNGYDAIAWTKGETQAARYDLSKQVDELFIKLDPETQKVSISADDKILAGDIPVSKMEDYIGKDVAKRASDKLNEPQALDPMSGIREAMLEGTDLKVGGEFHKNLYDRKLTRMKTWKKLGMKVEEGRLGKDEPGAVDVTEYPSMTIRAKDPDLKSVPAHIVRLSPEVKAKVVEEGMARFQPAGKGEYNPGLGLEVLRGTTPKGLPARPTVLQAAQWFQDRVGKPLDWKKAAPEEIEAFDNAAVAEVKNAMELHPEAAGWYDENLGLATSILREVDPSLAQPKNDFILKLMTALTSDGNEVSGQFNQAWDTYSHWRDTGKYTGKFASGDRVGNIRKNIKLAEAIVKKLGGEETARDWLRQVGTLSEVRKAAQRDLGLSAEEAQKIGTGETVDAVVPYAVAFGPKLGSFFNNLFGDYSSVTMDRWFMRTVGRLTGTQVQKITATKMAQARHRLRSAFDRLKPSEKKLLNATKSDAKGTGADAAAKKLSTHFSKKENRKGLTKAKKGVKRADQDWSIKGRAMDELRLAANSLEKLGKPLVEAPAGGNHRKWIRERIDNIQKKLKDEGIELENADLQALLWYNEKELYNAIGVRSRSGAADYASAAESIHERVRGRPSRAFAEGTGRVGRVGRGQDDVGVGRQGSESTPSKVTSSRFQPAESLTNGTAWRTADGYNVLQKGKRGKFRAYAPSGKLIGIYDQLKTAQKAAIRRLEKESGADQARFMPADTRTFYHGTNKGGLKKLKADLDPDSQIKGVSLTPEKIEAEVYASESAERGGGKPEIYEAQVKGKLADFREIMEVFQDKGTPRQIEKWLKDNGYVGIDYTFDPMLGYGVRVMDPKNVVIKKSSSKAKFQPAGEKPISEKSLDETLKDFTAERATAREEIESSITPRQKEAILYSESLKVEDPDSPLWGGMDGIWNNFLDKAADNRKRVRDAHKNTYFGIYSDYFEAAVKDPRFPTSTEIDGVPWSPASFVSKKLEGTGIMQYPVDTSMTVGETIKSIENQYKEAFGFVPEVSRNQ